MWHISSAMQPICTDCAQTWAAQCCEQVQHHSGLPGHIFIQHVPPVHALIPLSKLVTVRDFQGQVLLKTTLKTRSAFLGVRWCATSGTPYRAVRILHSIQRTYLHDECGA